MTLLMFGVKFDIYILRENNERDQGGSQMSFKCAICGKHPVAGKTISHSHRATNRVFRPNLQNQKIILDGRVQKAYVCTQCLKSGKVKKAV
jgi:large subunit ribosomal protein L28